MRREQPLSPYMMITLQSLSVPLPPRYNDCDGGR